MTNFTERDRITVFSSNHTSSYTCLIMQHMYMDRDTNPQRLALHMKNEKHRQLPRKPTEQHTTVICYNYTNTQTHVVPKHDCPVRSCSFVETVYTFVSASSLLMTTLSGLWVSGVSERECVFECGNV